MRQHLLFFTLTLLLTACSDNISKSQLPSTTTETDSEAPKPQAVQQREKAEVPATELVIKPLSGHTLYARKCASCHGKSGEKKALNSSQIIAGWEKERTSNALVGYQDESYGSKLKSIMRAQVKGFSDAEVEALSAYISTL